MELSSRDFEEKARNALKDPDLQIALQRIEKGFGHLRIAASKGLPEFETLRDEGRDIKNHVLENLDHYLVRFEEKVLASGGQVHWCGDSDEARATILKLCRDADAKTVTKGKSMIAEEIGINKYLEDNGIAPIETDMGEYIIQLADETPSHLLGPALHKTREQITELFYEQHQKYGRNARLTEGRELINEARGILREKYFAADVGITGANFLIAETGSTVIVTNEGNGDLTQLLPKMHIVIASLEKVVPTLEDASTLLRLLARSATGQEMSVYTTFSTGPRREDDLDGPAAFHVVLLDNGRSKLLGGPFQEVLRCIRCAACMNTCPVYGAVGGHAYGAVYMGPIGAVLTPHLVGIDDAYHLPNASTFCGRCEEVCPVRIPLPKLMRTWRERGFERELTPPRERWALKAWAWVAKRPRLYRLGTRIGMRTLHLLSFGRGRLKSVPFAGGWTGTRDLPAPEGETFMAAWRRGKRP
ncbi:MAG TPA: iron-sulfur cluster-binding protein [Sneathiellales bacterium]|jgi:L-lactate dehydrogenase complex protein LldF|nr:iron-sulfur cluster-binding protein [Sneathiellales bacterium]